MVAMVGRMDAVYPAGGPTDGISAVDACCVCGGGKGKSKTPENKQATCVDIPNFKDTHNTNCKQTEEYGNCKDGKPDKVSESQLKLDANSDGVSVLDACCACGGGLKFKQGEDKGKNSQNYKNS